MLTLMKAYGQWDMRMQSMRAESLARIACCGVRIELLDQSKDILVNLERSRGKHRELGGVGEGRQSRCWYVREVTVGYL
jgi:hypothetical protein